MSPVLFIHIFRHEDLKQMLDSNKDNLKLEAMKRIIGMVAKVSKYTKTDVKTPQKLKFSILITGT